MQIAAKRKSLAHGSVARREEQISRFIPYTRHLDETTLKTKDGYLLKIIKLDGLPFETADQVDINMRKQIRATCLRGLSSSRFAIYHHIIRREENRPLDGCFDNDWCRNLDQAYQQRLSSKKLFINEQYITIVRRPLRGAIGLMTGIGNTFSARIDRQKQKAQDREALHDLDETVTTLLTTLAPYRPELLGFRTDGQGLTISEPLSFLSYLINLDRAPVRPPRSGLDQYLPRKRLSFGRETFEVRGAAPDDVRLGAVLSIKEYADGTGPGMLDNLLRLPHAFIVTQSFGFVDRQASLSAMRETKRKLIAGEQGAASLESDLDHAIDDLASGRSTFGEHHLTVTVLAKDATELSRVVGNCVSSFVNLGIIAVREDLNLEPAFWAQLPGNFSYIARRALISNGNFSGFASLHTFPAGRAAGNHWGPAITRLETTSGTPYWFNFHERDVGNFTVIGPTGTGKTVLLTFLHAQAQRLNPKTVYFDKDHGAEIYLRAMGGTYTTVQAGKPTELNPLQLPDTPVNRAFLRDFIKLLATTGNETPLSSRDIDIITDAVSANYQTPPQYRRLSIFAELLSGHEKRHGNSLAARMASWHGKGERAWLFDNEGDTLSLENRNIGFDLTSILDDRASRTPWLMYVFHRISQILNGDKTIIMLDEGWKMLDDPAFAAKIKDWMKTIRKQNGLIGFGTQSARDALGSRAGDAIIEQSPTQIFFPNPRAAEQDYCGGFGLSRHELRIVRELTPESRCFLLRHGTDSVIARLDLAGMEDYIAVLSGRTETVRLMHELMELNGEDPALWLPEFQTRRKRL